VHTVFGKVTDGIEVVRKLQRGDRMDRLTVHEDAA
jgi:cyclophilin family peptidyl-prolyl cis-trans isomerase